MTMPASGALNMGGTTSPVSVAQELGLGLTTTISMDQANVRTLAGVGGTGTSWSMSSLYGKSAFTLGFVGGTSVSADTYTSDTTNYVSFVFSSNGAMSYTSQGGVEGSIVCPTAWGSPLTGGIGSGFEVRLAISYNNGQGELTVGGTDYSTFTGNTAWFSLASSTTIYAAVFNPGGGFKEVDILGTVQVRRISDGQTVSLPFNATLVVNA